MTTYQSFQIKWRVNCQNHVAIAEIRIVNMNLILWFVEID